MDGVFGRLWCQVCPELWEARVLSCTVRLIRRKGTAWDWKQCWSPTSGPARFELRLGCSQLCEFGRITYFPWVHTGSTTGSWWERSPFKVEVMVGEQTGSVPGGLHSPPPIQYAKQNSWQKMTALGSRIYLLSP